MNKKCRFDTDTMQFHGTALEQARCLLRFVKLQGNVDDAAATLPPTLGALLTDQGSLGFTKVKLRAALAKRGVLEANIGGSLDHGVSRANNNDEVASPANYFVIHDTSTPLPDGKGFDPDFINTSTWTGNHLENMAGGKTHVYITRNGRTKTDNDYQTPFRATKFEMKHVGSDISAIHKGRFLHHELVQPRKVENGSDAKSPDPGFTPIQYELLALCYLAASLRRGRWLVPAFHAVLDLEVGDHDDPQHFDLAKWDSVLGTLLAELAAKPDPVPTPTLRSSILRDDPTLQKVARGALILVSTGGVVAGIGPVQDGINFLASFGAEQGIDLGGNRGSFGPRTKAALVAFQKHHGLAETGKVDSETLLHLDTLLAPPREEFRTKPASSQTQDGAGGSTTTGLQGTKTTEGDIVTIEATEIVTAKRDHKSLGGPKTLHQKRVTQNGITTVTQADYCWTLARQLPSAILNASAGGLSSSEDSFSGKATFFGKFDNMDEGTGTPAFGTVQTDSSVFGISLPRQRLLDEGLAEVGSGGVLRATDKGKTARVEVFYSVTGRSALLPLVDVGPAPSTNAAADLTVAAACFLQKREEDDTKHLDNIQVSMVIKA